MYKGNRVKILVFSGAGISRESGLETFRGAGGLWNGYRVEDVCSAKAWRENPEIVLSFYNDRRREVKKASPNIAHIALAELESHYTDVTIVTQNVDDLHERAGSSRVIHLHGEIMKVRGAKHIDEDTLFHWTEDIKMGDTLSNLCDGAISKEQLRPHIVFFSEPLPYIDFTKAQKAASEADVLIVVGTSLEVDPASRIPEYCSAKTIYLIDPNITSTMESKLEGFGKVLHCIHKPASEGILEAIKSIKQSFLG